MPYECCFYIEHLQLQRTPKVAFYKETYRASESSLPVHYLALHRARTFQQLFNYLLHKAISRHSTTFKATNAGTSLQATHY
jgi:predicted cupin superfamily sugar epimerase